MIDFDYIDGLRDDNYSYNETLRETVNHIFRHNSGGKRILELDNGFCIEKEDEY